MPHFYRNSLICCLATLLPGIVFARSYKDADAVVTMRNGNPCFSYPQDSEIQKRPYSISYLSVSPIKTDRGGWLTTIYYGEKKSVLNPNTPENCIEYGVLNPGMKEEHAAIPILPDTPYRVFIQVSAVPGFDRKFATEFCITKNEKDELVVVEAGGNGKGAWSCLIPGESANRGFWGWLFGK